MNSRIVIASLSFSVVGGLAGLVGYEHYTDTAVIPTKNDRPTVGFGSTFREDGSPVAMGDTIDPVKAVQRLASHIAKDEHGLKQCMEGVELNQTEYDVFVDFTYQYGVVAACKSSMAEAYRRGDYSAACEAYTLYKYSGGYDCSTLIDGKPNKRCYVVWTRSLKRRDRCMEESHD